MTFTEWVEKGGLEDLDNMKRPQLIQKAWDFYRDFTPHTRQERILKEELLEGINKFKNVDLKRVITEAAESYSNTEKRKERMKHFAEGGEKRFSKALQEIYTEEGKTFDEKYSEFTNIELTDKQTEKASEIFEEIADRDLDISSSFTISSDEVIEYIYNSAIDNETNINDIVDRLVELGIAKEQTPKLQQQTEKPESLSDQVKREKEKRARKIKDSIDNSLMKTGKGGGRKKRI